MCRNGTFFWLLRVNGWQARNWLRNLSRGDVISNLLFLALLLVFFGSAYGLFLRLFDNLLNAPVLGEFGLAELLVFRIISMVFLTFLVLLLFSNAVTALACLYLAQDVELLLPQPLSFRLLYLYKYLQATFHSSWMVLIFGGPVLAAYGSAMLAPWWYYPAAFLLLIPFAFIPSAVGVVIVNVIMYFVPLARLRLVLVGIGFTFGGLLIAFFRALSPRRIFDPRLFTNLQDYLASFSMPATPYLPNHFAAQAVTAWARGDAAWPPLLLVLGLALGLSLLATLIGGRLYFHGLATGNRGDSRVADTRCRIRARSVRGALMEKEIAFFLREPTQWSQLLVLLALVVVHLVNIRDLPLEIPLLYNFISFLNIGLIGAILVAVAVRFIFPAISLEGEGFWVLAAAPLRLRDLYWSKFHVHFWPLLLGAQALTAVANWTLHASPFYWVLSMTLVAVMAAVLTALGLLCGALWPKFAYNHVSDIATSAGGMMYMMLALGYVGLTFAALTLPVYVHFFAVVHWRAVWQPLAWSLTGLLALNVVLFFGSASWTRHALDRLARSA